MISSCDNERRIYEQKVYTSRVSLRIFDLFKLLLKKLLMLLYSSNLALPTIIKQR
jgi:hypothetical protein